MAPKSTSDKDGKQVKGTLMTIIISMTSTMETFNTNRLVTVGDKSYYIGTCNEATVGSTVIDGIGVLFLTILQANR